MDVSERIETRNCKTHGDYQARLINFAGKEVGGACQACIAEREAKAAEFSGDKKEIGWGEPDPLLCPPSL